MKASTALRTYSSTLKKFLNMSMLHGGYPMGVVHHTDRSKDWRLHAFWGWVFFGFFKFELSLTGGERMIFFFCIYSLIYVSWAFQLCLLLSLYSALSYSPPNISYWSLDWSNLRFPLPLWKVFPHGNDEGRSIKNT